MVCETRCAANSAAIGKGRNTPSTTTKPLRRLLALAAITSASLPAPTLPAHAHGEAHSHAPQHGGVVVEMKDMDLELVAKPDVLQLYLCDHGKPADVSKAGAKVMLLNGTEKQEATLAPAGGRLEAKDKVEIPTTADVPEPGTQDHSTTLLTRATTQD